MKTMVTFLMTLLMTSLALAQIDQCKNLENKTIISNAEVEGLGFVTFSDAKDSENTVGKFHVSMYDNLGIFIGKGPIENLGGLEMSAIEKRGFYFKPNYYTSSSEVFNLAIVSSCKSSKSNNEIVYFVIGVVGNNVK